MPSETDPDPTSEPLGPAPDDAAGFDAWARQGYDTWQRAVVMGEAGRRWADAERPAADRLLAGVWGSSVGAPPASELVPLLDDPSVDPVLRARAQAVVALELVPVRSEDAVQLVEHALAAIGDDVPIRTRLSVWFAACEVYARAGRGPRAVEVLEEFQRSTLVDSPITTDLIDALLHALPAEANPINRIFATNAWRAVLRCGSSTYVS